MKRIYFFLTVMLLFSACKNNQNATEKAVEEEVLNIPGNTREELQVFDPDLYNLLAEYFPQTNMQISKHKKVNEYGNQ